MNPVRSISMLLMLFAALSSTQENMLVEAGARYSGSRYSPSTRTITRRYVAYRPTTRYSYVYHSYGYSYHSYGGTVVVSGNPVVTALSIICLIGCIICCAAFGRRGHVEDEIIVEETVIEHHEEPTRVVAYPDGVKPGDAPPQYPPGYTPNNVY